MSRRGVPDEGVNTGQALLNRRVFLQRALVGAGAVAVGGVALGAWSRAANASSASKGAGIAGAMTGAEMSKHDMSSMRSGARLRDANALDVNQVQVARQSAVTAGVVNMDGEFYRRVQLPPRPNAKPLLDDKQSDALERRLSCPCPCNLDVFTCRTTDFACGNSPLVHRDVLALVAGGYSGDEIMKAMIGVYGNNILMAPPKEGVNLIAWFGPFVALAIGAVGVNWLLRTWRRNAQTAAAHGQAVSPMHAHDIGATNEEMDRLRAALRDDGRQ